MAKVSLSAIPRLMIAFPGAVTQEELIAAMQGGGASSGLLQAMQVTLAFETVEVGDLDCDGYKRCKYADGAGTAG